MSEKGAAAQVVGNAYKLFLAKTPFLSYEKKLKLYASYVNGISENTLETFSSQIISTIPLSKKESNKFKRTENQVEDILGKIPRLKKYCGILRAIVKHHRNTHSLRD